MKPHQNHPNEESDNWVSKTKLCQRALTLHDEIGRHKWYESEKAGHDIGWDRATIDWVLRHGMKDNDQDQSGSA